MLNQSALGTKTEIEILQDLLARFATYGSRPAVIAFREEGETVFTYDQLLDQGLRLAAGLRELGIGLNARIGLYAPPIPESVVVHLAAIVLGGVAVNFGGEMSGSALRKAIERTDCSVLFTTSTLLGQEGWTGAAPLPVYCLDEQEPQPGASAWTSLLRDMRAEPARVQSGDTAAIFFTSGTTGPPKLVPLSHASLAAALNALLALGVAKQGDKVLLPLPLYHVFPFVVGLLVPLASGASVVLPEGLGPIQIQRALGQAGADMVVAVPRLYEALLAGVEGRARARGWLACQAFTLLLGLSGLARRMLGLRLGRTLFSSVHRQLAPNLRVVVSGGAKLDLKVARRLEGLGWQVLSGYGLAETAALATINAPGASRLGTAGLPAADVAIRISEPDDEGVGEVLIRGPNVFDGYPDEARSTEAAFTEDGWFRTGDLGTLDADGYLRIEGRKKEILVLADGKNIAPEELEKIYGASPYVGELGVFERGGLLHAVIVPDLEQVRVASSQRIDDLVRISLAECAAGLASYLRLSGFVLTSHPLPRTPLGKLRRFMLSDLYEGGATATIPGRAKLNPEDRALLAGPRAKVLWEWLAKRFPDQPLSLDMNPQLDLGIDSLAWVDLGMEIESALGISLSEDMITGALTLRDLVSTAVAEPRAGVEDLDRELADLDRWLPEETLLRRLAGPVLYGVVWLFVRILMRLKVRGLEHVPPRGPVVIVANHASYLDPFALGMALKFRRLKRAAWATYAEYLLAAPSFIRWLAGLAWSFPVIDWAPRASVRLARAALEDGRILVWFPEEWRTPDGALQPFLPGIGRLLRGSDLCVIPAYIEGSFEAWPRTQPYPRPGHVEVRFGEPLHVSALERMGKGDTPETRIALALHDAVALTGLEHGLEHGRNPRNSEA